MGESRYETLLEAAPDALITFSGEGLIVFVNAHAEEVFGYPRSELLGHDVAMLVPDARSSLYAGDRRARLRGADSRTVGAAIQTLARRKDGTEFAAEVTLSTLDTADGPLVSAAIRDVAGRSHDEAVFRSLVESAADAIVVVSADGRILIVNEQAERMFGYSREQLNGELVEMLVPVGARQAHAKWLAHYAGDPHPRPMGSGFELLARRKDGSEFPAEIALATVDTPGGLLVSAAVRDVTERVEAQGERARLRALAERERLEVQLHQAQRLESLGQLAGGVAHDFNNLLAVILNYAAFVRVEVEAAARADDGARWEPVARDIEQIRRAAERATELTHQLLAFARREVVRPETLDLNAEVSHLESVLRHTLGEHLGLRLDLAPDLWPVTFDPGQFQQVLVSLAFNARDAMPGAGEMTISTKNIVVDTSYGRARFDPAPGSYVRIEVSDTGMGMDRDTLAKAFEPFFTTKPKGEGSGLGLATVHGMISQGGGYAQIYSEKGLGTTFRALLPVADGAVATAPAGVQPRRPVGGTETILLVEDEDSMREVSQRILGSAGYHVLTAADGDEALSIASQDTEGIDLLLTDVVMPGLLGKELADRVVRLLPGIRVVFMSGYAQPVLTSGGRLDDGVRLVEKPFSEAMLLDAVREVLDQGQP